MGTDQTERGSPENGVPEGMSAESPPDETQLSQLVRATTGRTRYRTEVTVRQHAFVVDEPPEVGGADAGPTPFEMVCTALASCTTITVRMYADRKGWPLEEIDARVEHARVPVERDGVTANLDRFTVTLGLSGNLDEAQRARLTEIASRCPVHRLLVAGSVVEVRPTISTDHEGSGG